MNTRTLTLLAIAVVAIGALGYTQIQTPSPDNNLEQLRIGHVPSPLTTPHYTAIEEGFYREAGFDAEMVQLPGPEIGKALLNGNLEVGSSATVPASFQRANDLPIKLVASRAGFTNDDPGGAYLVARNGSGIDSAEDIRGKTVCTSTAGSMGDLWLNMWADEHNMTIGEDFEHTYLGDETQYQTAFASGSVDACYLDISHPAYTFLQQDNLVKKIDEMPNGNWVAAFVAVREEWTTDHQDKLERFLTAYKKAAAYARENPDERIKNVAKHTPYSEDVLESTMLPTPPADLSVDTEALDRVQDLMTRYGMVEEDREMGPMIYNDAIQQVQQQLESQG